MSLWQEVWDDFGDGKEILCSNSLASDQICSELLRVATETRRTSVTGRWKFKVPGRRPIIIRDVMEKMITWIQKFVAVGDCAVQYDPVHAAPVWAPIRFLLQTAVNNKEKFCAVVQNLEVSARFITRYALIEEVYSPQKAGLSSQLRGCIVRMYENILVLLVKAVKYMGSTTMTKIASSFGPGADDPEITEMLQIDNMVSKWIDLQDARLLRRTATTIDQSLHLLASLEAPILRVADVGSVAMRLLEDHDRLAFLQWLSTIPYYQQHQAYGDTRIAATCEWLAQEPQYLAWKQESCSSIFYLTGARGCGKSFVASKVIDDALAENSQSTAYFYCSTDATREKCSQASEILLCLLRQLSVQQGTQTHVFDGILSEYKARQHDSQHHGFPIPRLRDPECVDFILEATSVGAATIVIDAIDQLPAEERYKLSQSISEMCTASSNVIQVFLTARDDQQILSLFSPSQTLRVSKHHNSADLRRIVDHQVSQAMMTGCLLNYSASDRLKQDLRNCLVELSQDLLLLSGLHLAHLKSIQLVTEWDLRTAMQSLTTKSLDDLYSEVYARTSIRGSIGHAMSKAIFTLLMGARERFTPDTFLQALMLFDVFRENPIQLDQIQAVTCNLVYREVEHDSFVFIHPTFKEFLLTQCEFESNRVQQQLAEICLLQLWEGRCADQSIAKTDVSQDFYVYSILYWPIHTSMANVPGTKTLQDKLTDFVFDPFQYFDAYLRDLEKVSQALDKFHPCMKSISAIINDEYSPIFLSGLFGLDSLIHQLPDGTNWDMHNRNSNTAVYLAAVNGHESTVQMLLDRGASASRGSGHFPSALHAACHHGHVQILRLLSPSIGSGASKAQLDCLQYACRGGQNATVLWLLQDHIRVTSQPDFDKIFQILLSAGQIEAIQWFQNAYGVRYEDRDTTRRKIEHLILHGRTGPLQSLLRQEQYEIPSYAISIAAFNGHDKLISFLIDKQFPINEGGPYGHALTCAALQGHLSTIQLLISNGADIEIASLYGRALQAACLPGHDAIVRCLISAGADVNGNSGFYGTALQAAANRGHTIVVRLLIDSGADIYQRGKWEDAFYAAVAGGMADVVQILLDRGYAGDLEDDTKMLCAVFKSFHRSSKQPRSFEWESRYYASAGDNLSQSLQLFNPSMIATLSDLLPTDLAQTHAVSTPAIPFSERLSPLIDAVRLDSPNLVKLLTKHAASLKITDVQIESAFLEACAVGNLHAVVQLASCTQDQSVIVDGTCKACRNGDLDLFQFLSSRMSAISRRDRDLTQKFLICASEGGHLHIIEPLLCSAYEEYGRSSRDNLFETVAVELAQNGHFQVFNDLINTSPSLQRESWIKIHTAACKHANLEVVDSIHARLPVNFDKEDLIAKGLKLAMDDGLCSVFQHLRSRSGFIHNSSLDDTAYLMAAEKGCVDLLQEFLDIQSGTSFAYDLNMALLIAARNGHHKIVALLLESGADPCAPIAVRQLSEDPQVNNIQSPQSDIEQRHHDLIPDNDEVTLVTGFQAAFLAPFDGWVDVVDDTRHKVLSAMLDHTAISAIPIELQDELLVSAVQTQSTGILALFSRHEFVIRDCEIYHRCMAAVVNRTSRWTSSAQELILAVEKLAAGIRLQPDQVEHLLLEASTQLESQVRDHEFRIEDMLDHQSGFTVPWLLSQLPVGAARFKEFPGLLQMACMRNDHRVFDVLLGHGVDVNKSAYPYGTALYAAANHGHVSLVERLLGAGADPDLVSGAYDTAIRAAARGGHHSCMKVLLAKGASLCPQKGSVLELTLPHMRYPKRPQRSILLLAVDSGDLDTVSLVVASMLSDSSFNLQLLLQAGLLQAAEKDEPSILQYLLDQGANAALVSAAGDLDGTGYVCHRNTCPLHVASSHGRETAVMLLLFRGALLNQNIEAEGTPLDVAYRNCHTRVVRLLIDAGAVPVHSSASPSILCIAAARGDLDFLRFLRRSGVHMRQADGRNVIAAAIHAGEADTVLLDLLVTMLNDLDTETKSVAIEKALLAAAKNDDVLTLQRLWPEYSQGLSSIHYRASSSGAMTVLRWLSQIHGSPSRDSSPLHIAARQLNVDDVQSLVRDGHDVNLIDPAYGTPLISALEGCLARYLQSSATPKIRHLPAKFCYSLPIFDLPSYKELSQCERVVSILCKADVTSEIDHLGPFGGTALHLACLLGSVPMVSELIRAGAQVNVFEGPFQTPLLAAVRGRHLEIVEMLLESGANIDPVDVSETPLEVACRQSDWRLFQALLDHDACPHGSGPTLIHEILQQSVRFNDRQRRIGVQMVHSLLTATTTCHPKIQMIGKDWAAAAIADCSTTHISGFLPMFLEYQPNTTFTADEIREIADTVVETRSVEVLAKLPQRITSLIDRCGDEEAKLTLTQEILSKCRALDEEDNK